LVFLVHTAESVNIWDVTLNVLVRWYCEQVHISPTTWCPHLSQLTDSHTSRQQSSSVTTCTRHWWLYTITL